MFDCRMASVEHRAALATQGFVSVNVTYGNRQAPWFAMPCS